VGRQRGVDGVEELSRGGGVPGRRADDLHLARHLRRDAPERLGAPVEPLLKFGLDPRRRRRIRGAEPAPLEDPAGERDEQRGDEAGAHNAQDENHCEPQDTRVL
jgi:hypothetical protein